MIRLSDAVELLPEGGGVVARDARLTQVRRGQIDGFGNGFNRKIPQ